MKALILFCFVSLISFSASAKCLDGYYDFGPQAAALGFACGEKQDSAQIIFCKRPILLERGICTGQRQPVNCQWNETENLWLCEEFGNYPFTAWIDKSGPDTIRYRFKSSFNSGELKGTKIKN